MSVIKCFPNICRHIWDVCLILRWLPWHLNQINGFQLRKLEWHNTANVIRGLLGCRDPIAMATRRQAPKPSQKKERKKRWLPWRVNYWRCCRRGATGTAASGVLGHSYPVARVIQVGDRHPSLVHHGNVIMATGASGTCASPKQTNKH